MNSYATQMKANRVITCLLPMLQAYVQVLRDNYPEYPKRVYKRNSNNHQFELVFETTILELLDGNKIANAIELTIFHNREKVFWLELPGAGFIILEGINENTEVVVKICENDNWNEFLEDQIPYLIREVHI